MSVLAHPRTPSCSGAELLRQIVRALFEQTPISSPVLVGLSGGMDSMLLLDLLLSEGADVEAIHVNYGLRNEADADEDFVRRWCEERGVKIHIVKPAPSSAPDTGIQNWARSVRYDAFHRIAIETRRRDVYVGHHADDQLETLILNLLRGTGLAGLAGMQTVRELKRGTGIILRRPFLRIARRDLVQCAIERNLDWVEDASNQSLRYARNVVRDELAHMATRDLDEFVACATVLSTKLAELRSNVRSVVEEAVSLSIADLKPLSPELRQWILLEWISAHAPEAPRRRAIAEALHGLIDSQTGKKVDLGRWQVWRERDELLIREVASRTMTGESVEGDQNDAHDVCVELDVSQECTIKLPTGLLHHRLVSTLDSLYTEDPNIAHLALDSHLSCTCKIRRWGPGDRFVPLGGEGSRKVKRFLTDRRVPSHERGDVFVVELNGSIAWVVGHRPDERFRVHDGTQHIVELTWSPNA